jgi:hypothetical protein
MDDWPLWKRVSFVNVVTLIGISMGFASAQAPLSPSYCVPVAVLAGALMNVMFLVVRPQIIKARREGLLPPTVWVALWSVVRERPVIILIVVLQMIGTSRSLTTAAIFIQSSRSSYARSLPSASMIATRMIAMSFLMTTVAAIWLLSAIGLWKGWRWSWWLAVVLNGLAAGTSMALQLLIRTEYLLDAVSTIALVLLFLPVVRTRYGKPLRTSQSD